MLDIEKLRGEFENDYERRNGVLAGWIRTPLGQVVFIHDDVESEWQGFQAHAALQEAKPAIPGELTLRAMYSMTNPPKLLGHDVLDADGKLVGCVKAKPELNQCDGCRTHSEIKDGLHVDRYGKPFIGCEKRKYEAKPEAALVPQPQCFMCYGTGKHAMAVALPAGVPVPPVRMVDCKQCEVRLVDSVKAHFNLLRPPVIAQPVPEAAVAQKMADKFLGWKLPKDFSPDCGITFDGRKDDEWNNGKTWPTGTNLFTADQAKVMFEYCTQLANGETKPEAAAVVPMSDEEIDAIWSALPGIQLHNDAAKRGLKTEYVVRLAFARALLAANGEVES